MSKLRPTILSLTLVIFTAAILIKLLVLPALAVNREVNFIRYPGGILAPLPFWPQYWRRIRGIPEPEDSTEALRSDDGGIVMLTVVGATLIFVLMFKFKRYFIK